MARKSKYSIEVQDRIVKAIRTGATYQLACKYGGISEDTFARWREDNADFAEAIKAAEGQAAVGWLEKIEAASEGGTWQAAAWKLERRYPYEYGKQVQDVNMNVDGSIELVEVVRNK